MATKSKKGMGIKTSVKSGNFRATKKGAGMTEKGVKAYRKANPGSKLKPLLQRRTPLSHVQSAESRFVRDLRDK